LYVCSEPKDMVVSLWHCLGRILPGLLFQNVFQSACDGTMGYGPFWENLLGYWGASITWPDNVLFLRNEEMLHDPMETVQRLAHFVGQPFSAADVEDGVVRDIVEL
jgi:hydroxyjasmonate sulfotransferase